LSWQLRKICTDVHRCFSDLRFCEFVTASVPQRTLRAAIFTVRTVTTTGVSG